MTSKKVTHPFQDYILERDPSKVKPEHKTLVEFQRDLNIELGKAFSTSLHPYKKVNVLLLCWETADANNYADCQTFKDFLTQEYHFAVEVFQIGGTGLKPNKKTLMMKLHALAEDSDEQTLSIICYSGHGYSNSANPKRKERKDLIIFPREDISQAPNFNPESIDFGIDYSEIFKLLEWIEGDVLHILECCNGGGAVLDSPHEVLAASASHQPGKRKPSATPSGRFLNAIIKSLRELKKTLVTFTTVQLHSYLATHALNFDPELYIQPFYSGTFEHERRPITLTPLLPVTHQEPVRRPTILVKEAKALLSITLTHGRQHARDMVKEMRAWLTSRDRPFWVKGVELVGVLPTNSSVMLITLPISLWHVLPEHPAYKMIDIVTGGNLLLENPGQHLLSRPMSTLNLRATTSGPSNPTLRTSASSENIRPSSSSKE